MEKAFWKRKKIGLCLVVLMLGTLVSVRDVLVTKIVEMTLSYSLDKEGWSVVKMQREKNTLAIREFSVKTLESEAFVNKAELTFHVSLWPLFLKTTIHVEDLSLTIHEKEALKALLTYGGASAMSRMELVVEEGELLFPADDLAFSFQVKPSQGPQEILRLRVQEKGREEDLINACFREENKKIVSEIQMSQGKISSLLPCLLAGFSDSERLAGTINVLATCSFSKKGELEALEAKLAIEDLDFYHPSWNLLAKSQSLSGTLSFVPEKDLPLWKQMDLFLTFEESSFYVSKEKESFGIQDALGEVRIRPEEDPYVKALGTVMMKNASLPFEIEGKGEPLENGAYWLQGSVLFSLPKQPCKLSFSLCQSDEKESALEIECNHLVKEPFDVLGLIIATLGYPKVQMLGGEIEGKFFAKLVSERLQKVEFFGCQGKELRFVIPEKDLSFYAQEISFQGVLEADVKGDLQFVSSEVEVHKADILYKELAIKEMASLVKITDSAFEPSYLEGVYSGMKASLQLLPSTSSHLFHLECGAYPQEISKCFSIGKPLNSKDPILLALDVGGQEEKSYFTGTIRLCSKQVEEDIEFEGYLDKKISRRVSDLLSAWDLSSLRGSFQADRLSTKTLFPYLEAFFGQISLEGEAKVKGSFTEKEMSIGVMQASFSFVEGQKKAFCKIGGHEEAAFHYSKGKWSGSIPLDEALWEDKKQHLFIEVADSLLLLNEGRLYASQAKISAPQGGGVLSFSFDGSCLEAGIEQFKGQIASLSSFVGQGDLSGIKGSFFSLQDACKVRAVKEQDVWNWTWQASLATQDFSWDLGEKGGLEEGKLQVQADSTGKFAILGAEALYRLSSFSCVLSFKDFSLLEESPFTFCGKEESRELFLLQGSLFKENKGFKIEFQPSCHLLGVKTKIEPFFFDKEKGKISPFKGEFHLDLAYLQAYVNVGQKMGLWQEINVPAACGILQVKTFYDFCSDQLELGVKSPSLTYEGEKIGAVHMHLQKRGNEVQIDPCAIGPHVLKVRLQLQNKDWKISSFSLESPDLSATLQGTYNPLSQQVFIPSFIANRQTQKDKIKAQGSFQGIFGKKGLEGQGTLSILGSTVLIPGAVIRSTKEIPFLLASTKGIILEKSQWEVLGAQKELLASFTPSRLEYLFKGAVLVIPEASALKITKEGQPYLHEKAPSFFGKKEAFIQIGGEVSPLHKKLSGSLKNGTYEIQDKALEVSQARFLWEQDEFYASLQTSWEKEPLFLQMQIKQGHTPSLTLVIKEEIDKKGLCVYFHPLTKDKWCIESAQGSFRGLDLQLTRKKGSHQKALFYEGFVEVDCLKAFSLFPKSMQELGKKFSLGKGYRYQGSMGLHPETLQIEELTGEISGKSFQCLGRTFSSFQGKISLREHKGGIQGFTLSDDVGTLSIKTVELMQDEEGKWTFFAPLIHMKEFSPSFLTKGKKEGALIKNMSIYDLKGVVGENKTIKGKGSLHFTTPMEKEFSFWDAPLSLIKDFGLDPGLLTPVTGEVDFEFLNGKVYLTGLKNMYSEARRSQFDLAEPGTDAYLDLDGTWHIDLQMRQNVVLKVAEKLILSVRGTLEKPKYSFKWKDAP